MYCRGLLIGEIRATLIEIMRYNMDQISKKAAFFFCDSVRQDNSTTQSWTTSVGFMWGIQTKTRNKYHFLCLILVDFCTSTCKRLWGSIWGSERSKAGTSWCQVWPLEVKIRSLGFDWAIKVFYFGPPRVDFEPVWVKFGPLELETLNQHL